MLSLIIVALVMMSPHSNANPKTEVGTRDWGTAVINVTILLFRRMWIWDFLKQWNASVGLCGPF